MCVLPFQKPFVPLTFCCQKEAGVLLLNVSNGKARRQILLTEYSQKIISLSDEKKKTKSIDSEVNPVWNEVNPLHKQ